MGFILKTFFKAKEFGLRQVSSNSFAQERAEITEILNIPTEIIESKVLKICFVYFCRYYLTSSLY